MQSLLLEQPSQVAAIKKLQLSFASANVTDQCPLSSPDLDVVRNFITAIDALDELSVLYYEPDDGSDHFWPVVFHHAKSLRSLSVHTPPQHDGSRVWTPATAGRVVAELTGLEHLEVDIPLEEAEGLVSVDDNGIATSCAGDGSSGIVDEVAKMTRLKSLLVNVSLEDEASSFAEEHTWDVIGAISFPEPKKEVCKRLARVLMAKFPAGAAMRKIQVRIARRCWDDRFQFWTLGYTIQVGRDNRRDVAVDHKAWEEYLPAWPEYGGTCGLCRSCKREQRFGKRRQ